MQSSSLERLAPLSGIVGVALMVAGATVAGLFFYLPSSDVISNHFNANATQAVVGSYLGLLSSFFLIWFSGSLWEELRRHEGGSGRVSALAFGSGIAGGLAVGAGFVMILVAGSRAGAAGGLDAIAAVTLYDLFGNLSGILFGVALAVTIGATAVLAFRRRAFPSWFGWISALLAILLLTPVSYLGLYLAPVWLAAVSLWVYARGRTA